MRHQLIFSFVCLAALLYSCGDMYKSLEDYSGEIVYPAKYDTIVGHIGFERVEIDLMKAGRVSSKNIMLGKAQKTVIEYEDQVVIIDSLVSWVNIKGLTLPKLYRFKIYTIDEYKNRSVPKEIALIPYTSTDLANLVVSSPRVMASPSSAVIDWANGLSSVLLAYDSLFFKYTDKDGAIREGKRGKDSRFFIGNLESGKASKVDVKYRVVPKVNGKAIIDTVDLVQPLVLNMPTGSTPFTPAEKDILTANGITNFTANGVAGLTKLVFPIHANSLQDLFYFSNLKEIDLTGGDLFSLPKLLYSGNGATSEVGGGKWIPFMRKAGNISNGNMQAIKDLLESGILKKVLYVPNSMGLDALLAPYIMSGIVELVNLPDEVLIPNNLFVNGLVQATTFRMDITYPATDAPVGAGLQNIYKTVLKEKNGSFVFALPKEYQFNINEYKFLKMKVYAPAKSTFSGVYAPYQRLWPRFMNYLWAFPGNSSFGQEGWAPSADNFKIPDANLEKWTDITVDLSQALNRHNRVVLINIGGEPSLTFAPPADIVYYFANFRFTKK